MLRKLIRMIILESENAKPSKVVASTPEKQSPEEDLLLEPDFTEDEARQEASVAGAVAGVSTPLGTGPSYPNKMKRKKKGKKATIKHAGVDWYKLSQN